MNRRVIALLISTVFVGCGATKDLAQSLGTTGTGAIVGTIVGAGAGVGCSKAGGNSALCAAAGVAAGSAAGYLAAELDESWSSTVPVVDCKGVTKQLAFTPSKNKPYKVAASIKSPKSIYKKGEVIQPELDVKIAGTETSEVPLKLVDKINNKQSSLLKKPCGGFNMPIGAIESDKEGPVKIHYDIVDENGKVLTSARSCITVSESGKNLCK